MVREWGTFSCLRLALPTTLVALRKNACFLESLKRWARSSNCGQEPPGCRLIVREPKIAAETQVADSISVNGCCLTVVERQGDTFAFQAGPETLARTNLGELKPGSRVNLERALAVGDRLGGHFVSGHIDGVGTLLTRDDCGEWSTFWFSVPRELAVQMASKGSIAVDGVSLTIVDSEPDRFSIALIPYTLAVTTLGPLAARRQGESRNRHAGQVRAAAGRGEGVVGRPALAVVRPVYLV